MTTDEEEQIQAKQRQTEVDNDLIMCLTAESPLLDIELKALKQTNSKMMNSLINQKCSDNSKQTKH